MPATSPSATRRRRHPPAAHEPRRRRRQWRHREGVPVQLDDDGYVVWTAPVVARIRHDRGLIAPDGNNWKALFAQLRACVAVEIHRRDFAGNVIAVARQLVEHAVRDTGVARPTHKIICEKTRLSRDTVRVCINWLIEHRWIVRLERGMLARFRQDGTTDKNRAATYLLCMTAPPEPRNPASTPSFSGVAVPNGTKAPRDASACGKRSKCQSVEGSALGSLTKKSTRTEYALDVRRRIPPLHKAAWWLVAAIVEPFRAAGYSPADVEWAVYQTPQGQRWGAAAPRCPLAWAKHRLSYWRIDGICMTSLSQRKHEDRQADLAEGRRRREQWRLQDAAAASPETARRWASEMMRRIPGGPA